MSTTDYSARYQIENFTKHEIYCSLSLTLDCDSVSGADTPSWVWCCACIVPTVAGPGWRDSVAAAISSFSTSTGTTPLNRKGKKHHESKVSEVITTILTLASTQAPYIEKFLWEANPLDH